MPLLNTTNGNTKIRKSAKGSGYRIASLSLLPDLRICPGSKAAQCLDDCLRYSGRGSMSNVENARARKTELWLNDRAKFLEILFDELHAFIRSCNRSGDKPAARLNTLSDVPWEKYGVFETFPDLLGYDYTKIASRLGKTPANYELMFSYSAAPAYAGNVARALKTDCPIAAVFRGGLPETFLGRPVIDGDKSDLFNLKARGKIVGLKLKGPRRVQQSSSPFIVDVEQLEGIAA